MPHETENPINESLKAIRNVLERIYSKLTLIPLIYGRLLTMATKQDLINAQKATTDVLTGVQKSVADLASRLSAPAPQESFDDVIAAEQANAATLGSIKTALDAIAPATPAPVVAQPAGSITAQ